MRITRIIYAHNVCACAHRKKGQEDLKNQVEMVSNKTRSSQLKRIKKIKKDKPKLIKIKLILTY